MPSIRRVRVFAIIIFSAVIYVLYLTSNARKTRSPDFYSKTKQALDRGTYHPHSPPKGSIDGDDAELEITMKSRLKEAEKQAKDNANAKAPNPPVLSPVEEKAKPIVEDIAREKMATDMNVAGRQGYETDEGVVGKVVKVDNSAEDREVKAELDRILKRSPIIIFSKSYCPHSKRAKGILLDKYSIVPSPFVVELDEHPQGALIQDKLEESTGRRTVPNVLIQGRSIGGGDEVAELDMQGTLIETIRTMGGKQMQEVRERRS